MNLKSLTMTAVGVCLWAGYAMAQDVVVGLSQPPVQIELSGEQLSKMAEAFDVVSPNDPAEPAPGYVTGTELIRFDLAMTKASMKGVARAAWNNGTGSSLFAMALLPEIGGDEFDYVSVLGTVLGISDEQMQQIGERIGTIEENHNLFDGPEMQALQEKTEMFNGGEMSEAERLDFMKLAAKQTERMTLLSGNAFDEAINEVLPPEQIQQINEALLANMAEMPILSPGAFDALDLTDEQRKQMEQVKEELDAEFEEFLDDWLDGYLAKHTMMFETIDNAETMDWDEIMQAIMAEEAEYKKNFAEVMTRHRAFSEKFRTQMFDVLTDAQRQRLQALLDNPPAHALAFRAALRGGADEEEKESVAEPQADAPPAVWTPGPDSWQPGDVIPEAYRLERNARGNFPREE